MQKEKRGFMVETIPLGLCLGKGCADLVLDFLGDLQAVQCPSQQQPGHLLALGSGKVRVDRLLPLRGREERTYGLLAPG